MPKLKNRNDLILLRIAQADAYCMATEYIKPYSDADHNVLKEEAKLFKRYLKHPTHQLRPGQYTDDTQMSIAIAEHILSGRSSSSSEIADAFVRAFIRDKRDGYSRGFQAILEKCQTGADLIARVIPDSTKNGAMMRAVPVGIMSDVTDVLLLAAAQAKVTHDSEEGVVSACATAFLSHWALYSERSFEDAMDRMAMLWPTYKHVFLNSWRGPVVNRSQVISEMTAGTAHDVGINTVWAVCTLLREQRTLLGILDQVIEWGGDTDSVAAVAWGIASTRIHDDLPEFFERDLEPGGEYGSRFLVSLGKELMVLGEGKA